jgi:hypothetical protein
LAAAALYAAAFMAAALYAAALYAAVAYMERRATPAKESGVHGIPMIASAFLTNPNSGTERKTPTRATIVASKNDFIDLFLPKSAMKNPQSEYQNPRQFPKFETPNPKRCDGF